MISSHDLSSSARKPVFRASDQVLHKPGCAVQPQEMARGFNFDVESREIVLSM